MILCGEECFLFKNNYILSDYEYIVIVLECTFALPKGRIARAVEEPPLGAGILQGNAF